MGFADAAASITVDATFAAFGKAASYSPPGGGSGTPCTVILDGRDPGQRPDDGRPIVGTSIIEVRKSEISSPVKSGVFTLTVGGATYAISNRPEKSDPDGLVWTMWAA